MLISHESSIYLLQIVLKCLKTPPKSVFGWGSAPDPVRQLITLPIPLVVPLQTSQFTPKPGAVG